MSIFEYYRDIFKGKLEEPIVSELEPQATDIINQYVLSLVLDKLLKFDEYGDYRRAICYELELLNQTGKDAIHGASGENDVTAIKTSGYEISISATRRNQYVWKGLPLHIMSKMIVENELKANGFMEMLVNQ